MNSIKLTLLSSIFLLYGFLNYSTAQWVQVSSGMGNLPVLSSAYSGNYLFAGTGGGYGVYLSTNNGTSWTQTLFNQDVYSLEAWGNNVFAGTYANGVYFSANNGATWFQTSLGNHYVRSLAVNGNNVFAGTFGLYLSTDNGTSWTQTLFNQYVYSLAVNGNYVFAGTGNGVFLSVDNGASWTQTSLNNRQVDALAVDGDNVYAGTYFYGVYFSPDNGTSWYYTALDNQNVRSLAVSGNNIFAGTHPSNGVFVSNDNGASWIQRNEGLTSYQVLALSILNNYIFAGTNNSVYRRPLGELIGINPISEQVPAHYALEQNYPNPFNPTTKFKIQISRLSDTRVTVYDLLGREVEILVNQQLKPGTYEVDWDASNEPSGVYYYKLITDEYTETKKMVLIK